MGKSDRKTLLFLFFLAFIPFLLSPALLPKLRLTFWAPFIVFCYYRFPLIICLWISLACGLSIDLISSTHSFGMHMLAYSVTTGLLYGRKKFFFEDEITTIPLLTIFFSLAWTVIQASLVHLFGGNLGISLAWVFTDLIIMPLLDGLYAFVWFTVPLILWNKTRKWHRKSPSRSSRPK